MYSTIIIFFYILIFFFFKNKLKDDVKTTGIPQKKLLYVIYTNPSYTDDNHICVQNYPEVTNISSILIYVFNNYPWSTKIDKQFRFM